jgi:hypothetical protein
VNADADNDPPDFHSPRSLASQPVLPAVPRQPGAGARLVSFEPWPTPHPSLAGHATVDFNGWIVSKIAIFRRRDGTLSAGVPSYPQIDADGRVRVDDAGKRLYVAAIRFVGDGAQERWQRAVLTALADAGVSP